MESKIQEYRVQIDQIDHQIRELLNKRATHAQSIGHLKGEKAVYRPDREAQVLRRAVADNAGPLPNSAIFRLQREVMSACLALEKPLLIGFLADLDSSSEMAVRLQFGQSAQVQIFREEALLMEQVRLGQVDYGIISFTENSGSSLLDLTKEGLYLCGEVFVSNLEEKDAVSTFVAFGKEAIPVSGIDKTLVLLEGKITDLKSLIEKQDIKLMVKNVNVLSENLENPMMLLEFSEHQDSERFKQFLKRVEEGSFPIRFISSYPDLSDCGK